ncbi:heavy metal transporter [Aeromicrobium sp. Root495]|uniref:heavy-metal-associated domain-containing protein n=1 Tax=Aeromicrobium sp. Root495 TaxID=1736550 RepID=UPI0006FB7906|nr:heavy metal-associated domain-containing protein [Aeromicrobium sp. Root495]KQY55965.1 heavy metal transporter [Aeromicrobium sp. Root495]
MSTSTWKVTGLTCAHCVGAVTEEVSALDGVQDVTVDLVAGGTSTVHVTSDTTLSREAVAAAVDEAGYALAGDRDLPLA